MKEDKIIIDKQELFQNWVFNISDDLEELLEEFKKKGIDLDYSINSLDVIENWILENFDTKEILIEEKNKYILDSLSKYIGEVYIKNIGGRWEIELLNKEDIYFNLPVINGGKNESPIAPLTMLTACISRKKGNYISTILKNYLDE